MLSGQIGHYKYYKIEDMYKSRGCTECHSHTRFYNSLFPEAPINQHDYCTRCPIFMAVKLTKLYAEKLSEYEERYEDDGR